MNEHEKINYIEFPAKELQATKDFFAKAFGWAFEDFGPEYTAFSNQGVDGGFFKSEQKPTPGNGAALVILYSSNLEETQRKVIEVGGIISKEIFSFPGGRRFHFVEPSGNELAVWSEVDL